MIIAFFLLFSPFAQAFGLRVVAAEGVYGALAQQLGGDGVHVTSILNNPAQDPHIFNASPSVARAVADADIVIYNGLGYDTWMQRLLAVSKHPKASIIVVAEIADKKSGDNPHLWYDPTVMPLLAQALTQEFKRHDPTHEKLYEQRLQQFQKEDAQFQKYIQELKQRLQGKPIIATEPVFQYMAEALGLQMLGMDVQISIMNHIAPSAKQLQQFENIMHQRQVKVMIYNQQVSQPITERLQKLAQENDLVVVGISETQPQGMSYLQWMKSQLTLLAKAYHVS